MILVEQAQADGAALPVADLRAHLRLGSGFADDSFQDPELERVLDGAIALVEALTGKALIARGFVLTVQSWRDLGRQVLPKAPLVSLDGLAMIDTAGLRGQIGVEAVHVSRDTHWPALVAKGFVLPSIPVGGAAEIAFTAGFGAWTEVPGNLRLAVLEIAAFHYENRSEPCGLPKGVVELLAPWRALRIGRGR